LQADFFAFELLNGHIYLHLDLGSGGVKVKATTRRVDDGMWHEATLRRTGKDGRVTVDGTAADFSTPGEWNNASVCGVRHVAPCSLVEKYGRFRETCCHHQQDA
jgi:leucine-rich repeat transmembrane neuronal protein 1/2